MADSTDTATNARIFRLLDFLTKRLEQTLAHNETSTRHIYLVNGAILAAVYFAFGREWPLWSSFLVSGVLALLLGIVNWLHANFLHVQHAWYRTIDQEIRRLFLTFEGFAQIWPEHLGEVRDRVLEDMKRNRWVFCFSRTHRVYVALHLVLASFLVLVSVVFLVAALFVWSRGGA